MRLLPPLLVLVFLAGCATPASRIEANQAYFDRLPVAAQQKIRAGQVDVGFTPEMVRLALGEPDRVYTHQGPPGAIEVWGYRDHTPQFSFGVGMGTSSGNYSQHSSVGAGVAVTTGGYDPGDKVRVEFLEGRVTGVTTMKH